MNSREFLKELMRRNDDNPHALAQKTKVPQPTIYRFLTGTAREPRVSTLEPIAKHYGVPVEAFISESARSMVVDTWTGGKGSTTVRETSAPTWPFSAPFELWEKLDDEKKKRLDERVADFLAGAEPSTPRKSSAPKKAA